MTTSLAPREAKWSAMARPIPREAPVTMATRSWSGEDGAPVLAVLLVSEAIIRLETGENEKDSYIYFQYMCIFHYDSIFYHKSSLESFSPMESYERIRQTLRHI